MCTLGAAAYNMVRIRNVHAFLEAHDPYLNYLDADNCAPSNEPVVPED